MPTTTYVDDSFGAFAIGARTDDTGSAVDDVSAEESRLINQILTAGIVEPTDGWLVAERGAGANMSVDVGSGVAKSDLAVVEGQIAGQGRYLVRKELATVNVTVPAADVSQARTDEVYLVVADAPYDSGSLALPRIGYRQGDAGGGAPGPDSSWDAYLKLATISVPANDTAITDSQITDNRVTSYLSATLADESIPATALEPTTLTSFFVEGDSATNGPVALTTSFANVRTVTLNIPAEWNTWKVTGWASVVSDTIGGGTPTEYYLRMLDHVDSEFAYMEVVNGVTYAGPYRQPGTLVGRMPASSGAGGSLTFKLQAKRGTSQGQLRYVSVVFRATRLS